MEKNFCQQNFNTIIILKEISLTLFYLQLK